MGSITLTVKYKKNQRTVISPEELIALYLYGINIRSKDGSILDRSVFLRYIQAAQLEVERYLDIKLFPQLINETNSYYRDEYTTNFPIITTAYPVYTPLSLIGLLNDVEQIVYPEAWLKSKSINDFYHERRIFILPVGSSTLQGSGDVLLTGITAQTGLGVFKNIPHYWNTQYITGYADIPADLVNVIGKLASIGIFNILGDIVLGSPGVSNYSLSIDGLSQSVNTTNSSSSSAFGARIKNYQLEIKDTLDKIKNSVKGFGFVAM